MKVFCIDCKHLKSDKGINHNCKHSDNTVSSQEPDTWLEPGNYRKQYLMIPRDINVLNQCPWFERNSE